jgi:hypothetical protein
MKKDGAVAASVVLIFAVSVSPTPAVVCVAVDARSSKGVVMAALVSTFAASMQSELSVLM